GDGDGLRGSGRRRGARRRLQRRWRRRRGGRLGGGSRAERLPGRGIVRDEAEDLLPGVPLLSRSACLPVESRHLLVDGGGLAGIPQVLEASGQEREGLDRGGIRLEGDL